MGRRIDRLIGTPEARAAHRQAKQHLAQVTDRDRDETPDYYAANQAVIDAEQQLPKWRRYPTGPARGTR
ncbi:hypothetical protein [Streptomyces sp. 8L]|uniref:hypothetical protein n=1 Tax=Streptomyces sp. 8L TaxID=2877242 RepID=UPI001CD3B4FE|nr:hypothetical protein [Streptomyces sp. 8L]MCA1224297.1 hypothetical protein [Streptomyces sp. 8L]